MATTIYTPAMLRGAGTRGVPEIPAGSSFSNTYSMAFDGSDDYVDCGNNSSLQPTSGITLSAWFMIPAGSLHYSSDTLISQDHTGYAGTHNGYSMDCTIASNGYLYYQFYLENGTALTRVVGATNSGGTPPYVGDTWYHLCGTWDGSDMVLYINGVSLGTVAFTGPITYNASISTLIGKRRTGINWLGSIDEVSLFNVGKNSSEVTAIYNSGIPTDLTGETGLAGWWRMGDGATWDGSDWSIPDASSNSNTGASENMDEADRVADVPS
tara:strand:- start:28 stop:831 length:804 start_codon:yes stop_codon:yes gene_type:complete